MCVMFFLVLIPNEFIIPCDCGTEKCAELWKSHTELFVVCVIFFWFWFWGAGVPNKLHSKKLASAAKKLQAHSAVQRESEGSVFDTSEGKDPLKFTLGQGKVGVFVWERAREHERTQESMWEKVIFPCACDLCRRRMCVCGRECHRNESCHA